MHKGIVTIFGADGFLGHHVVRAAVKDGWRVRAVVRRPHTTPELRVIGSVGQVQIVQGNIRYPQSISTALEGVDAVINLVGILHKSGDNTFDSVHHEGAKNIGETATTARITNVVHVSALGADTESNSKYLASKAHGEIALHAACPSADIMRPSVLFGKGEGFFTKFARLATLSPAMPLIYGGKTRFQPVYVGDVAKAIATRIREGSTGQIYELGGPNTYSMKELMKFVLTAVDRRRPLIPVPWPVLWVMGFFYEFWAAIPLVNLLIKPMITRDQLRALRTDNVVSGQYPGLEALGIDGKTIEAIVPSSLIAYRKYGQFHEIITE